MNLVCLMILEKLLPQCWRIGCGTPRSFKTFLAITKTIGESFRGISWRKWHGLGRPHPERFILGKSFWHELTWNTTWTPIQKNRNNSGASGWGKSQACPIPRIWILEVPLDISWVDMMPDIMATCGHGFFPQISSLDLKREGCSTPKRVGDIEPWFWNPAPRSRRKRWSRISWEERQGTMRFSKWPVLCKNRHIASWRMLPYIVNAPQLGKTFFPLFSDC